ncbi:WXG100 family type VII secretion target [Corynebacterium sp. CCUG 71335]|uniref:WXG100 family type VII secretion target n=1 Tax=Corynebacterium sp. CCUG 71335 TaxID=2823892 RepID=UPI00210C71A5|nr:WXG100 family type VII secretion target [Corynebacterium sp. CCUG 71335]MCQ4621509.1 WXG100 family type VII secretion target [Corynebacterium sp. CCUG 71335]
MSVYSYKMSDAEQAADDLNSVMNNIESTLMEMESDMHKLAAGWEGSEQEHYQGIHGKWNSAADNIKMILGQVREALDDNTSNVAETRNRAARSISGE